MHIYRYTFGKFKRTEEQMCIIIYSSDIKTETLQNSLLSYKDDFLLWHSTR